MAHGMTLMTRKSLSVAAVVTILLIASAAGEPNHAGDYFAIQVVDRQTGRGVPLVELKTTNNIRYFTDSNGIVAFLEPGLMDREVFFFVESHGYEFPKDGFGFHGTRLRTTPGATAVVKIDRINIAERLYRVTGQGIYRDSVLVGRPVPLANPVLNGQVTGQDSVDTCIYHDRLFWFWGDTGRVSYPLGHFAMAGAVSDLPGRGGLDPAVGVNLEYFVDKDGFSRPMARLKEPGLVWLDGFLAVRDNDGCERMVAKYARLKDLGTTLERGLMAFNDDTGSFEPVIRSDPNSDVLPSPDFGHAFPVTVNGRRYYYFAMPFPLRVRMRVEAVWNSVIDPNHYEVLTALQGGRHRWVRFGEITGADVSARARMAKALKQEKENIRFHDMESGKEITPHGGSVYFNAHRHKWVAIFLQIGGESSMLGEVWYAEADTPVGPWAYARKVATHNKYSFYNPKHHPYFDQDGGRTIYFEGTYSWTFSGSEERATPRYDYNQIMYRLNLDDPCLVLPTPVYEIRDGEDNRRYLPGEAVAQAGKWEDVESVAFYAVNPRRGDNRMITVYADKLPNGFASLTTHPGDASATPVFHALPPTGQTPANECIVPLYAYRHADSGRRLYATQTPSDQAGWSREQEPLCQVWKTPPGPMLLDAEGRPIERQ